MHSNKLDHPPQEQLLEYGLGKLDPDEAHAVETHIAACDQCSETLLRLEDDTFVKLVRRSDAVELPADAAQVGQRGDVPAATAQGAAADAASAVEDFELPDALAGHARYRIVELVGHGGMGNVYKAEHRVMNRPVALKVINRALVERPQAAERFQREVHAAARLSHPNIVTAYDAEQAGDSHFLVMEFVDGTDLYALVKQDGPLPIDTACDYICQAARGLQHAHQSGMVHRDMKPHNLMVTAEGQVKILDFGLASLADALECGDSSSLSLDDPASEKESGQRSRSQERLTAMGAMMGTPDFISPEQCRNAGSADVRSDIYGLGCTLYYLLAGGPPFAGDSVADKLKAHAQRQSPKLSHSREDVPAELQAVLDRMMAKDPGERFQTAAEVADALAGFVDRHRTDRGGGVGLPAGTSAPTNPLPITFALCLAGSLSTVAFVLGGTLFMSAEWLAGVPNWIRTWLQFGGLASLPVGVTVLILADRSERGQSHRSAVSAGLLNLLPLNPFLVVLLPLTIWTLLRLRHPSARTMYENCPPLDRAEHNRRWPLVITTVACLLIAIYAGTYFIAQLAQPATKSDAGRPPETDAARSAVSEQKLIQGTWGRVAVTSNGQQIGSEDFAGEKLTFLGDTFFEPGKQRPRRGRFVLDETIDPKQIDFHVPHERDGFLVFRGIYQLDGGRLSIFMQEDITATTRPTDFTTRPGDKRSLQIFERVPDRDLLQGAWRVVALEAAGQTAPESSFKDDRFVFAENRISLGNPDELRPFRLNPSASPKEIDIGRGTGGQFSKAIYELHGDTLKLCFSQQTKDPRPKDFNTEGTRYFCYTLKRDQP